MTTRDELAAAVNVANAAWNAANTALAEFDALPENNVYETLDEATGAVEDALLDQAREDCECAGNCGLDKYTQAFIVGGVTYVGTLRVEYDRHDKTYYYVDRREFTYKEAEAQTA